MPNYKSPDNAVHFLDSAEFEYLLPAGSIQISEEEAEALRPIPEAVILPASCTPWQIRKALNSLGLRQAVEDAVAASDDIALKDGWEFATEFRSDDPFVISMGAMLGKDAEETRELIEMAASL
jgi:cobalamin biosynthesis protein CbiG